MNYATIKKTDVANGPGVRVSLFVSGCTHHCKGCFNSVAWDFQYGQAYTLETEQEILQALAPDYIRGLSLLGGEPMEPQNRATVLSLVKTAQKLTVPQLMQHVMLQRTLLQQDWLTSAKSSCLTQSV
mgnify:CR=1 FL=1